MYTDGALATLDFTAPYWAAEFTGTWIGPDLALESVEIFPYFGTDYQVTERLTGVLVGDVLSGTYRYVECDLTNAPWSCPADGICEVRADFSVTLP